MLAAILAVTVGAVFAFAAGSRAAATQLPFVGSAPSLTAPLVARAVQDFMATDEFAEQVFDGYRFATMSSENRKLLRRSLVPGESASFEVAFSPAENQWRVTVTWARPDLEKMARFTFHVLDNGTIWYVGRLPCYPGSWWPDCG